MKNNTFGIMYDHSMFPYYRDSFWHHCICTGTYCTTYCGCNFRRVRLLAPNSVGYQCISYCDTYSYDCSSRIVVNYDINLKKGYEITFPEKAEFKNIIVYYSDNNKNLNNVVPHPYTYSLFPDNLYPEVHIIDDILLFFSRKSFVTFLDKADGKYKTVWVIDENRYLVEEVDPIMFKNIDQKFKYFDVKDEKTNRIFRFTLNNNVFEYEDVTDQYPINYKLVKKLIIPCYPMKADSDYLMTYELHFDSTQGRIFFELFKEKTDIRSYHYVSTNATDPYKNVVQYSYFDEFYENYTVKMSMFFNNNHSKGKYPGFRVYDKYQIWRNIKINFDTINQDLPFEDVYCYIIRSDFKIVGKRIINRGDSVEVNKYDDRIVVRIGNLDLFNQSYINGSDYVDVFEDLFFDKSLDYYIVFANNDFYSRFIDLCYNYRFIYCDYNDTRYFLREDVNKNPLNKAVLEWRPGIQIQNIKYIDYTHLAKKLSMDYEDEDNMYMWGVCGYRTKCGGDVWNYVLFVDGDQKPYISFRSKEDFRISTIGHVLNDEKFKIGIKTFLFNIPFLMYLITFFETFCGDIEFLMWNRPIDLRKLSEAYMENPPSVYFDEKTHPVFDDKHRIIWENLPRTDYDHFTMFFCTPIMPEIGRSDGLTQTSSRRGDDYVELKEWLVFLRGTDTVEKYLYKEPMYAEHTPGKHANTQLNRQEQYYPYESYCMSPKPNLLITPDRVEPDVTILVVDPKDVNNPEKVHPYLPWKLGYRIKHKCKPNDTRFRIRCAYELKDRTYHVLFTETINKMIHGNGYIICCVVEYYQADFKVEVWHDTKPFLRYDLIDSTSNPYTISGYKELQTKNIVPDKYYNEHVKLIDHIYTTIYESNKPGREIPEGDLKDVEESSKRHEYYPLQYMVKGQWRYVMYFNTLNYENEYIHDILIETVSIYDNTIRYMQGRRQAVVEYAVMNVDQMKHYYGLSESPSYCLEYNIKTSYPNIGHSNLTGIVLTFHFNQTAIFNEYYTKGTTHYFSYPKEIKEMPLYPFNFINTTTANR